jgi:N-acetyltransferase
MSARVETRIEFQPELRGEIVSLSPLRESDFELLFAAASDPLIWEMHPMSTRWQRDVFTAFFEESMASRGGLCVRDAKTGAVIGHSRYSTEFCEEGEAEIGWSFLTRAYWGGPANRDKKTLMMENAFQFADAIIYRVGDTNLRSRRAVEKLGGILTDRVEMLDTPHGPAKYITYVIRCEDWLSARP